MDYIAIVISTAALGVSLRKEIREWLKSRVKLAIHPEYIKSMQPAKNGHFEEQLQLTLTVTNKSRTPFTVAGFSYTADKDKDATCTTYLQAMKTLSEGEATTFNFQIKPFPTTITNVHVLDAEKIHHRGMSRRKMSAFSKRYASDIAYVRKCAKGS